MQFTGRSSPPCASVPALAVAGDVDEAACCRLAGARHADPGLYRSRARDRSLGCFDQPWVCHYLRLIAGHGAVADLVDLGREYFRDVFRNGQRRRQPR